MLVLVFCKLTKSNVVSNISAIDIVNKIMNTKTTTSSADFGLGSDVVKSLEEAPLDVTQLQRGLYHERCFSKKDEKKRKSKTTTKKKKEKNRRGRRRLVGVATLSSLRNLFRRLLIAIDTGCFEFSRAFLFTVCVVCFLCDSEKQTIVLCCVVIR